VGGCTRYCIEHILPPARYCITMHGINSVKSTCNLLYTPLDMENKTKKIIKTTSVGSVCLRSQRSWTKCSNKMCLLWLMFRCCFKASRFENRMLQSNFVWRVNSGSAMISANEGTSCDLQLLQWRWCSSSLPACDYLKNYDMASYAGFVKRLFFMCQRPLH